MSEGLAAALNAAAAAGYSRQYERWREGLLGAAAPVCQNGSDTAAMRAVGEDDQLLVPNGKPVLCWNPILPWLFCP